MYMAVAGILCALFMSACGKTAENAAVPMETAQESAGIGDSAEKGAGEAGIAGTAADSAPTVTWNGMIEEVGINSFTASEIFTDVAEDGLVMVYEPEAEDKVMIEVAYTERTAFTIRTTKNSGTEYSDSPGSSADLKEDISCVMTGSWDGERFLAFEILIYHHQ